MYSELEWHPWNWREEEGLPSDLKYWALSRNWFGRDLVGFFCSAVPEGGAVRTESRRLRLPVYRRALKYSRYFNNSGFAVALFFLFAASDGGL